MTLSEVESFQVDVGTPIPTLQAVLETVRTSASVYVELKGEGIERQVLDVIASSPAARVCAVHSFDHSAVARSRAHDPLVPGGILVDKYPRDAAADMAAADAVYLWAHWKIIDKRLVDAAHDGGSLIAWTVNDGAVARKLAAWGVDGLCTDDVPRIARTLADHS